MTLKDWLRRYGPRLSAPAKAELWAAVQDPQNDEREAFRAGWLSGHGLDARTVTGALLGYEERAWQRYVVERVERDGR